VKKRNIFFVVLILALFCAASCSSASKIYSGSPHPYSFAENEYGTATITFFSDIYSNGVDLHYFENTELPIPERGSYWAPVLFPAGRPFALIVNIYGSRTERGNEVAFNCPVLAAGKNYVLTYEVEIENARFFLGIQLSERSEKHFLRLRETKKPGEFEKFKAITRRDVVFEQELQS